MRCWTWRRLRSNDKPSKEGIWLISGFFHFFLYCWPLCNQLAAVASTTRLHISSGSSQCKHWRKQVTLLVVQVLAIFSNLFVVAVGYHVIVVLNAEVYVLSSSRPSQQLLFWSSKEEYAISSYMQQQSIISNILMMQQTNKRSQFARTQSVEKRRTQKGFCEGQLLQCP